MAMEQMVGMIDALVDKVEDWSRLPSEPLVSVCMTTYNHEKYIGQALDGVLMQEVDFSYEIVIGEDCSTDRTREIVCDYQRRHPDKIRLRLSRENLWSHKLKNSIGVLHACRGRYIALCEGDDYWADPLKLQKQVATLEAEPEVSGCFTNTAIVNDNGDLQPSAWLGSGRPASFGRKPQKTYLSQSDMIRGHCIPTCTLFARADLIREMPPWTHQVPTGDWSLAMTLTEHGPVKFVDEVTAVYRRHSGGIWTSRSSFQQMIFFALRMKIYLPHAKPEVRPVLERELSKCLDHLRRHGVGLLALRLEKGRILDGQENELAKVFDWSELRHMRLDAWERCFQQAYFKGDIHAARRRLTGLLARHPEWLFRRGSLGQIVRTMRGF